MNTFLHDLLILSRSLIPILGAAAVALADYFALALVAEALSRRGSSNRLDAFAQRRSDQRAAEKVAFGGEEHRLRVAFSMVCIDVAGREVFYLWIARAALGGALFVGLQIVGLPLLTALVGFPAGYILLNGFVQQAWNKVRPTTIYFFIHMLAAMIVPLVMGSWRCFSKRPLFYTQQNLPVLEGWQVLCHTIACKVISYIVSKKSIGCIIGNNAAL